MGPHVVVMSVDACLSCHCLDGARRVLGIGREPPFVAGRAWGRRAVDRSARTSPVRRGGATSTHSFCRDGTTSWTRSCTSCWKRNGWIKRAGRVKRESTRAGAGCRQGCHRALRTQVRQRNEAMNGDITFPRSEEERVSTLRSRVTIKTGSLSKSVR